MADPHRAFLGVLLGLLLIYRECLRPGSIIPGVGGGVLMMLSLFNLSRYPLRTEGLAYLFIGLALLVLQGFKKWAWIPAIVGSAAMVFGVLRLVAVPEIGLSYALLVLPFSAVTVYLLRVAVRARRNKLIA